MVVSILLILLAMGKLLRCLWKNGTEGCSGDCGSCALWRE